MERKIINTNRKAFHNYFIIEKYEAGVVLSGFEVKALREGQSNLTDGFVKIENDEAYLENIYIPPYKMQSSHVMDYSPTRQRKLLLHKAEITKLGSKIRERGLTLVPLEIYFSGKNIAKITLGLAKGKTSVDKRDTLKKRDIEREQMRVE